MNRQFSPSLPVNSPSKHERGRGRRRDLVLAIGSLSFLATRPAAANGRFPASNQILLSPADSSVIVARTTYGILVSRDGGGSWRLLCEDALGLPQDAFQDPELGVTGNGSLVAGLYSPAFGLDVSANLGCDWTCVGGALDHQRIADLVVRPDNPHAVLALTSTFLPADAGGGTFAQVFESDDDGVTWSALGVPIDPAVLVETIDVAATDPHRVYVSGTRGFGSARAASLWVSTDDANSWTERALDAFDATAESSVYIGGVDPTDADRVYLRSSAMQSGGESRLYVTDDAGQSFQLAQAFTVPDQGVLAVTGEILGFALSPDGSKIYAGTKEAGLFLANRGELVFRQTSAIHLQCLATRGPEVWACSDAVSGFVVGVSTDDGVTFAPKLPGITALVGPVACDAAAGGPLACGAAANASTCADAFHQLCLGYEATAGPCLDEGDGGGATDAGPAPRHGSSSCGCSVPRHASAMGAGAVLGAAAAATWRRRARRPRRPSVRVP